MKLQHEWQVKIENRIYHTSFDEIVKKIRKGMILRQDQVKCGNLP